MALTFDLTLNSFTEDCETYNICDTTIYGNGEVERNLRANYLVAWTFENGIKKYTIVTPVDTNVTTVEEYIILTPLDDSYYFKLFSISFYSSPQVFNASDVRYYSPTNKVYIAKSTGVDINPDDSNGADFWEEVIMDANLIVDTIKSFEDIINNSTIEEFDYADVVTCRTDDCLRNLLEKAVDAELCNPNCIPKDIVKDLDRMYILANGIQALNWGNKMAEASTVIKSLQDFCDLQ